MSIRNRRALSQTQTSAALANGTATDLVQVKLDANAAYTGPLVLYGFSLKKSAANGSVQVRFFADASRNVLLQQVTFSMTSITLEAGDPSNNGRYAPSGVWWDAIGDATSATHTIDITCDVEPVN